MYCARVKDIILFRLISVTVRIGISDGNIILTNKSAKRKIIDNGLFGQLSVRTLFYWRVDGTLFQQKLDGTPF